MREGPRNICPAQAVISVYFRRSSQNAKSHGSLGTERINRMLTIVQLYNTSTLTNYGFVFAEIGQHVEEAEKGKTQESKERDRACRCSQCTVSRVVESI